MESKYIVLQYDMNNIAVDEICNLHEAIKKIAQNMEMDVITIPSAIHWTEMSREELLQVRGILDWVLEKKDDTNSETGTGSTDCG